MHILLIGGTRFVGYQLAWRLLAADHHVTLLNRGHMPDPFGQRVERLIADRTTPDFAQVLTGRSFEAVVDFAAYTAADARQSVATFGNGRVGHYIVISTGQVYLVREGCPRPAQEADYDGPLLPEPANDPVEQEEWRYGIDKRAMEDTLTAAWEESRFPATRLRLPMVNGERDHFRRLESYLWRILDGGPLLLPDGGTHATRHVYGGSVVQAITRLLGQADKAATFGQAYNLCQDETPTLAALLTTLAGLVGAPARLVPVPASVLAANHLPLTEVSPFSARWMSFLDPARAKAALGFQHEPLPRYLEKIVTCFLNHPPATPPANYTQRPAELALAGRLS
jgi:nucleoside-diphosphate-sugar epimerase